jgi:hypothetical protein
MCTSADISPGSSKRRGHSRDCGRRSIDSPWAPIRPAPPLRAKRWARSGSSSQPRRQAHHPRALPVGERDRAGVGRGGLLAAGVPTRVGAASGHRADKFRTSARLLRDGPNELPAGRSVPAWGRFLSQLAHFFALVLWVAGGLAFVAGLPQLGTAIFVVIVINGTFAFAQEFGAERTAAGLRDLRPRRAVVVRERNCGVMRPTRAGWSSGGA